LGLFDRGGRSRFFLGLDRLAGDPFEELVTCIAQGVGRLGLSDDANRGAALPQLAAEVGEVRIARHQAEGVGPLIEHRLQGIEGQRDV